MDEPELPANEKGQPGIAAAALFGLCPRCGRRTMFEGPIAFAPACSHCGLRFDRFNVGDGPAALVALVMGAVLVMVAAWLELAFGAPWWLHAIVLVPLTFALILGGLRVTKAFLLASEFRHEAAEAGRGGS